MHSTSPIPLYFSSMVRHASRIHLLPFVSNQFLVSANFGMQSFTYAEFVSLAAAKVWSGTADFPNTEGLWAWYDKAVEDRLGFGRWFQFYGAERTAEALRFFVGWLNGAAVKYGGRQIDNLSPECVVSHAHATDVDLIR